MRGRDQATGKGRLRREMSLSRVRYVCRGFGGGMVAWVVVVLVLGSLNVLDGGDAEVRD